MARLIRIDATGPIKIEPDQFPRDAAGELRPIFICACGLTKTAPICDGAHKACRTGEDPNFIYTYDPVTKQVVDKQPKDK
jgi:CDGSH-type Zn-finger protein